MCWNWQVSLITWLIATGSAVVLIRRGRPDDRILGLLLVAYGSIQLWEFFMWLDQECGSLNRFATYAAYFALYSHALAIGLGLYWERGVHIPMWIGLGIFCVGLVNTLRLSRFGCSQPLCGPSSWDCHLHWGFGVGFYVFVFTMCIALLLGYLRPLSKAVAVSMVFILSFILSYRPGRPVQLAVARGSASFWCFIAAAAGPLFLVLNR